MLIHQTVGKGGYLLRFILRQQVETKKVMPKRIRSPKIISKGENN